MAVRYVLWRRFMTAWCFSVCRFVLSDNIALVLSSVCHVVVICRLRRRLQCSRLKARWLICSDAWVYLSTGCCLSTQYAAVVLERREASVYLSHSRLLLVRPSPSTACGAALFCRLRRVKKEDMRRIAKATGASIVTTLADMDGNETFDPEVLGEAEEVSMNHVSVSRSRATTADQRLLDELNGRSTNGNKDGAKSPPPQHPLTVLHDCFRRAILVATCALTMHSKRSHPKIHKTSKVYRYLIESNPPAACVLTLGFGTARRRWRVDFLQGNQDPGVLHRRASRGQRLHAR